MSVAAAALVVVAADWSTRYSRLRSASKNETIVIKFLTAKTKKFDAGSASKVRCLEHRLSQVVGNGDLIWWLSDEG